MLDMEEDARNEEEMLTGVGAVAVAVYFWTVPPSWLKAAGLLRPPR